MATYQIREMSFGEILDGAFAVYRRHFGVLVGIAVVCTGLPAVIYMYMTMVGFAFVSAVTVLVWLVLYGVGGLVAAGATIHVIAQAYLGEVPRLGESIRFAWGEIGRIFVAGLAKYLIALRSVACGDRNCGRILCRVRSSHAGGGVGAGDPCSSKPQAILDVDARLQGQGIRRGCSSRGSVEPPLLGRRCPRSHLSQPRCHAQWRVFSTSVHHLSRATKRPHTPVL
jgi:hypothetical protein